MEKRLHNKPVLAREYEGVSLYGNTARLDPGLLYSTGDARISYANRQLGTHESLFNDNYIAFFRHTVHCLF